MRRQKLTLKTLNWPVVWIIAVYIIVIVALVMTGGCVNVIVNKEINVFVVNPIVQVEIE